jgi:FlaA1/EpsC-like NDP-sugar epimerase
MTLSNRRLFDRLFAPSPFKRFLSFFLLDLSIFVLSLYLSFVVYFEVSRNVDYLKLIRDVLAYFVITKLAAFGLFRVYRSTWRYFSIIDLFNVIAALAGANLILLVFSLVNLSPGLERALGSLTLPLAGFPKSVIFMDFTISLVLLSFLRISKRFYLEVARGRAPTSRGKRTLLLGAGNTGEMILRDMARQRFEDFYPIGFLDDDKGKVGAYIHGVKVVGDLGKLETIIGRFKVEAIVVTIPSLHRKTLTYLFNTARKLGVATIKISPKIYDVNKPEVSLRSLEDISLEDLVGRQSIVVDNSAISSFLRNKTVLVTGAGGSIGSEIAVQVHGFKPKRLVLFDIDETDLHNLGLRLTRVFPDYGPAVRFVAGDIRDEARVSEVFEEFKPQIVFHAAAYKHVPMMEYNPGEAVKVNIFGTHTVARASANNSVEKFVMISSDKAVSPTSVMGATKRIAEYVCNALNADGTGCRAQGTSDDVAGCGVRGAGDEIIRGAYVAGGRLQVAGSEQKSLPEPPGDNRELAEGIRQATEFVSVRFGNVLGSRGSVLPLFLEQLKYGGPLTVTHEDMKRYFMTIPEAVSLVLQAAVIGRGGEVLVLDMGEPVKITDIAEELIRMHGLEPRKDIQIQFTGVRPGEKLFEEILTAEEGSDASKHERIFVARDEENHTGEEMQAMLREFRLVLTGPSIERDEKIKNLLRKYVKYYKEAGTDAAERWTGTSAL